MEKWCSSVAPKARRKNCPPLPPQRQGGLSRGGVYPPQRQAGLSRGGVYPPQQQLGHPGGGVWGVLIWGPPPRSDVHPPQTRRRTARPRDSSTTFSYRAAHASRSLRSLSRTTNTRTATTQAYQRRPRGKAGERERGGRATKQKHTFRYFSRGSHITNFSPHPPRDSRVLTRPRWCNTARARRRRLVRWCRT